MLAEEMMAEAGVLPALKTLTSTSAKRLQEDGDKAENDIDYFDPKDVDIREQDNNSDIE